MSWPISWNDINEHLTSTKGGSLLPVVELTSLKTADGTQYELSDEESAQVKALADSCTPFIARFTVHDTSDLGAADIPFAVVLSYVGKGRVFIGQAYIISVVVGSANGENWFVTCIENEV